MQGDVQGSRARHKVEWLTKTGVFERQSAQSDFVQLGSRLRIAMIWESSYFVGSSVGLQADTGRSNSSIWRQLTIDLTGSHTLDLRLCLCLSKVCLSGAHNTEMTGQEKKYIPHLYTSQGWWLTPTAMNVKLRMSVAAGRKEAGKQSGLAGRRRRRCLCLQPTNWLWQTIHERSCRFDRERTIEW